MASPFAKPDLLELGKKLLSEGPVKTWPTPKRIRILFNGVYVADTTEALYVWEHPFYPYYYVPFSSFTKGVLHDSKASDSDSDEAGLRIMKLQAGERSTDRVLAFGGAKNAESGKNDDITRLRDMVRVEFAAADSWFEEDERIYVHPKDPFRRVEILPSGRPVTVSIEGTTVARAGNAMHLYETGLPRRFYLPATAVDPAVLRDSETTSECPYKGVANYYHVVLKDGDGGERVFRDVVWYYRNPTHESSQVAGALCFYNEKVDIELDGVKLERPKTHFA